MTIMIIAIVWSLAWAAFWYRLGYRQSERREAWAAHIRYRLPRSWGRIQSMDQKQAI
jgi:hypothetical protein